jgi:ATP-dependent Clp protease ATP-binding subunit ClpA
MKFGRRRSGAVEHATVVDELFRVAQDEAAAFRHDVIGAEHVLLALVGRDDETGRALRRLGLEASGVREDVRRIVGAGPEPGQIFDSGALSAIGIDLSAVRERVEASFGEGALERAWRQRGTCHGAAFGVMPRLKRALEQARTAAAERNENLAAADVALALAEQRESVAARILDEHAISPERLRAALAAGAGASS